MGFIFIGSLVFKYQSPVFRYPTPELHDAIALLSVGLQSTLPLTFGPLTVLLNLRNFWRELDSKVFIKCPQLINNSLCFKYKKFLINPSSACPKVASQVKNRNLSRLLANLGRLTCTTRLGCVYCFSTVFTHVQQQEVLVHPVIFLV